MPHRSIARLAVLFGALGLGALPGFSRAATVLHFDFNETGNAPGSSGTNRTPVVMRNDAGTALDFHSADGGGVSGLPGDRSFANTGPSAQGTSASAATNGFRANQPDLAAIDGLGAFTISGWFKTELANAAQIQGFTPRLVSNHDAEAGSAGDGFNLQFLSESEGDLKLEVDDDTGGGVSTLGSGARYSGRQKWIFFAVSYDGTTTTNNVNFYIGFRDDADAGGGPGSASVALVTTASLNRGAVDNETAGLTLANRPAGDRPFKGFLDEIRIDDVAHSGTGGLAVLESYRAAALVTPLDAGLRLVSSTTLSTAVLDQNSNPVTVPELSGISYDPSTDRFWAIGDNDGRVVQIDVDFDANGGILSASAVSAVSLAQVLDFEAVAHTNPTRNSVFLAEETGPGIHEYSLVNGSRLQTVSLPTLFTSSQRANRTLESLARSPDGLEMWTGVEQALVADGPAGTSTTVPTVSRLLRYAIAGNAATPAEQFAYVVEPQHVAGTGDGSSLSELIVLPNGEMLTLERSITDADTLVRAFLASTEGATDVSQGALGSGLIGQSYSPLTKTLLFSDESLGKFEGWAVGPTLANGDRVLLGVEDAGGSTAVIRSFVLSGDFSGDPCAGLGGDTDLDGVCDASDNCAAIDNPLQQNADADGLGDACDNCPLFASADQTDTDLDGRGNPCECGDVTLDGRNTVADLVGINACIFAPTPKPQNCQTFCDANNDGACNVSDIIAANLEIFSPTNTSICSRQPVPGP